LLNKPGLTKLFYKIGLAYANYKHESNKYSMFTANLELEHD